VRAALALKLLLSLVALVSTRTVAESAPDDPLSRQRAALDVIRKFADDFCKTVPLDGKTESVNSSGQAKAELGSLLKQLVDLGVEGAARYSREEWQGPLRESLESLVRDNLSVADDMSGLGSARSVR
jgi:hypothetical protein